MSGSMVIRPKTHCLSGQDSEGGGLWRHLTEVCTHAEVLILKSNLQGFLELLDYLRYVHELLTKMKI